MQNTILSTKSLSFSYDGTSPALSGIDLDIPEGKKIVFLGQNGSGKSTLFLHFNGVHKPDSGEVFFEGKKISYDAKSLSLLRTSVALVFQNPDDQIFSATVEEDVAFGPLNLNLPREEAERRVADALSLVGMENMRARPTQQLSFGQRKRVALAGALAMRPRVLLMDEPTAGLDPEMVHELLELSDELNHRGVTIVISTHDVETAYEWADEIRVLHKGKLVYSGEPDGFFARSDIHAFGLAPPMAFLLNQQMHWRTGAPELPRPKTFVELAVKLFPMKTGKTGTLSMACVNEQMLAKYGAKGAKSAKPRENKAHLLSGIYGGVARRLASLGAIDAHHHFHALEHGLLQASLGNDFTLYIDSSLCSLVEARALRLEQKTGLKIPISHIHFPEGD